MGISALLASQILDASATGRSVLTGADASAIRTTLGLGTLATQSPTGTPSASTFLRGDFSWQTIDLSGYVPYSGATGAVDLGSNAFTASRATLATGTITASTPALNVSQTWNNAATTFTGILANVTDTASNAASLLMDLQVGGSSRFSVSKAGEARGGNFSVSGTNAFQVFTSGTSRTGLWFDGGGGNVSLLLAANGRFAFGSSTVDANTPDTILVRDAAQTLAQRNSTNAQTFRIYNLFTDASNDERAKIAWESNVLRIGTEKAGTGSARALELQTDGVTRLTIGATSGISVFSAQVQGTSAIFSVGVNCGSGGNGLQLGSNARIYSAANNTIKLWNSNITDSPRLNFGGDTSSFPALDRAATTLRVRLADGSADGDFSCRAATFSGNVTVSAVNLVTDTTTGTKIGTATTQKIGFFNATPVVQPTAVADATDAASVITQLNALLSRMRTLGLIAT